MAAQKRSIPRLHQPLLKPAQHQRRVPLADLRHQHPDRHRVPPPQRPRQRIRSVVQLPRRRKDPVLRRLRNRLRRRRPFNTREIAAGESPRCSASVASETGLTRESRATGLFSSNAAPDVAAWQSVPGHKPDVRLTGSRQRARFSTASANDCLKGSLPPDPPSRSITPPSFRANPCQGGFMNHSSSTTASRRMQILQAAPRRSRGRRPA